MIALDTNLLLYAFSAEAPWHEEALEAIEAAARGGRGWGVPDACALEFWSVATRQVDRRALATCAEAAGFLGSLRQRGANFWQGGSDFPLRLFALAQRGGVRGQRIFDLAIALSALDNGATVLWTHDASFVSVEGLPVHDPL